MSYLQYGSTTIGIYIASRYATHLTGKAVPIQSLSPELGTYVALKFYLGLVWWRFGQPVFVRPQIFGIASSFYTPTIFIT